MNRLKREGLEDLNDTLSSLFGFSLVYRNGSYLIKTVNSNKHSVIYKPNYTNSINSYRNYRNSLYKTRSNYSFTIYEGNKQSAIRIIDDIIEPGKESISVLIKRDGKTWILNCMFSNDLNVPHLSLSLGGKDVIDDPSFMFDDFNSYATYVLPFTMITHDGDTTGEFYFLGREVLQTTLDKIRVLDSKNHDCIDANDKFKELDFTLERDHLYDILKDIFKYLNVSHNGLLNPIEKKSSIIITKNDVELLKRFLASRVSEFAKYMRRSKKEIINCINGMSEFGYFKRAYVTKKIGALSKLKRSNS